MPKKDDKAATKLISVRLITTVKTANILSHSRYLQSLQNMHAELADSDLEQSLVNCEALYHELKSIECYDQADEVEAKLIKSKAMFSFNWALAELHEVGEFSERGRLQTRFADLTIQIALRASWFRLAEKQPRLQKMVLEHNGELPGLFLLGLGKLGGYDLNFSSDTDLIAYFDPELLPVPTELGQSYICHQVLLALTKILGQGGRGDFVWRVDWRLRPNASATTLAMSTAAALDYYFYRASPWHRLALMKARVVAGDTAAGKAFFAALTPFIWRQNLDYRALDEIGEIKNKINLEHPALRVERLWREPISSNVTGFNVKLGAGGIREIEFIANALQLVWGGRHYELRTTNTLEALTVLATLDFLPAVQVEELSAAYRFLRRMENTLQIRGNQQTHLIPESGAGQQDLCELMCESDWSGLVSKLNEHRAKVAEHFESLFAEQAEASGPPIEWPIDLSESAKDIVKAWGNGFVDYGVSREMRGRLLPLARALSEALDDAVDASKTVLRLHEFFHTLPQGEQYFRLLAKSPNLLDAIIPPLLYSPAMSSLLKQSPHIVDCYMHADRLSFTDSATAALNFDSDYVLQAHSYELRLESARRFVNEQLYQLYLGFLQGAIKPEALQKHLTDLAEHTLNIIMQVVADHLQLEQVPVTVIGMGKMGVARMAPQSDLDLIFVFDPDYSSLEVATKFVARLQTAVSTPMREGVVYELDTRLRPSGRSGAPTVSIESFRNHHLKQAHTWEHIALVSADVIGGDMRLAEEIQNLKQAVVCTPRDQGQLLADAMKMWSRISAHRVQKTSEDGLFVKLREGGLMQAEYLAAVKILQQGSGLSKRYDQGHFYALLEQVDVELIADIGFWQKMQIWERLLGLEGKTLNDVPSMYQQVLCSHLGVRDLVEVSNQQQETAARVQALSAQLFSDLDQDWNGDAWKEAAVNWQS